MGMLWPTSNSFWAIAMIITLLVGGHEVVAHRITPGEFVAFNTYMILLIWPIIAVGWVVNLFQRGTASVTRIDELLHAEPAIDESDADPAIPAKTILLAKSNFAHLSFSYGDAAVLAERYHSRCPPVRVWPSSAQPVRQNNPRQSHFTAL